jgi:O-antigen/teichoic acid export membrane protein
MKKKLLSSFGFTLLSSGLFFGFNFFIAKVLGAENYGQISYYLSFIQILVLIISFNYAALYMGHKITKEDKNTFSLFVSVESIMFLILFVPAFLILQKYISDTVLIFLVMLIAYFSTLASVIGLEFNSKKQIPQSILYATLIPRVLLITVFLILMIVNLATVKNYLYAYLFGIFTIVVYFLFKFRPRFYLKKEFFHRAWKFYLLGIIGASFKPLANIFQKEYYGYLEVANLSLALLFLAGFYLVGSVLIKFILPKIHEAWKDKDLQSIEMLYANNTMLEVLLIAPLVVFILLNIDVIVKFLGPSYILLSMYLPILMIGFLPDLFTGITGNLLRATENEKYEIFNELLVLISGIGLIYFLRDYQYGVVLSIAISSFLYNIAKFIEVYLVLKITPFNLKNFMTLICYIVIIILFFEIFNLIDSLYLRMLFNFIFLSGVYLLVLKVIKKKNLLKGFI